MNAVMKREALIAEIERLMDIIHRAEIEFFKDGPDGIIAKNMLFILRQAKRKETK